MPGMVLEGGTFRPIFSCGVMDALLEKEVMFPYCIGVSAGAAYGISYVSRQKGRNLEIAKKYRHDRRYIGLTNFRSQRSIFGLDFVFGEVPNRLIPFDWDAYRAYEGKFMVGVTNALTGKAEHLDGAAIDKEFSMLRASCAIPVFFPAIYVNGIPYYDGGVADPIPIRKSRADGNKKNLIVLTRPKGYVKKPSTKNRAAVRILQKTYPEMGKALLNRHIRYNKMMQYCDKLEKAGDAIILRPAYALKSFEGDLQVLEQSYWHGYDLAMRKMAEIKKLFDHA